MKPKRYPYRFKPNRVNILDSRFYTRLIVETSDGKKIIAEVTFSCYRICYKAKTEI